MMKLIQGDAYNDNEKYYHSVSLNVVRGISYELEMGEGRGYTHRFY